ncbi:hypothetical protein F5878DRAFT_645758 [Lentinula raphanica]|uniref:Uncharacterized protein n=1 Tax=Lentinula raphanica TaxID=153919 RepID=A0AA38P066_9AGAR|nr:hypothetical protein F5878DRAFT_645758 [Lentinula raphanica]
MHIDSLPYVIRYKNPEFQRARAIPKLTKASSQYNCTVLFDTEERSLTSGNNFPLFLGMTRLTQGRTSTGLGKDSAVLRVVICLPRVPTRRARTELERELEGIRFQGGLDHTREAMRLLLQKKYILELPLAGFEDGIEPAWVKEQIEWERAYIKLVIELYGVEVHGAATETDGHELASWRLHRLFQNNCQYYERNYPADLKTLLEIANLSFVKLPV